MKTSDAQLNQDGDDNDDALEWPPRVATPEWRVADTAMPGLSYPHSPSGPPLFAGAASYAYS